MSCNMNDPLRKTYRCQQPTDSFYQNWLAIVSVQNKAKHDIKNRLTDLSFPENPRFFGEVFLMRGTDYTWPGSALSVEDPVAG